MQILILQRNFKFFRKRLFFTFNDTEYEDLILQNENNPFKDKIKIYKFDPKDHDEFDKKIININPPILNLCNC